MRRNIVLSLALIACTGGPLLAEPAAEATTPWYKKIFGSSKPKVDPKAEPPAPPSRQDVARSLEQEQKLYMERLQYCTRLRGIAGETNNEELLGKADKLEQLATDVYLERTRTLPTILSEVKTAETALSQKKPDSPKATASTETTTSNKVTSRLPNGKPIYARE